MAITEYAVEVWPLDLDSAFADDENEITELFTVTDTEGDHAGYAATASLGCGYIGKYGVPFNLCSATGTVDTLASRRKYTYGHG